MDRPIYKITIDPEYSDGEELGMSMIAFTSKPAIKVKGMAFNDVKPLSFKDDVKMRIVAPAMIPMQIYRRDEDGFEYDVEFTSETIEAIHAKFMQDLSNRDIFNLEHDTDKKVPAYILEAWIVDNPKEDKAFSTYGIEVPKGTLMLISQVTDKEYYDNLVESDQVGYSIEGFLGLKMSEILKLNTMKLPDGEHLIEGKIYIVKDGEVIEIKEETKEEMAAESMPEEEAKQEAETTVSDAEEDVQEEEEQTAAEDVAMAVDPTTDAEAVLAIVMPVIEEQVTQLVAMIADLKNQLEEALSSDQTEEEVDLKDVKMSSRELFKEFVKFSKTK